MTKENSKMHQSLSSSDTNIVSIKNQAQAGRNIKTPQSSNKGDIKDSSSKPTRLTLKMLSQNNKAKVLLWQ